MERREFEKNVDELLGMVIGEMGVDLLDGDEDTLKVLKVLKLAKDVIIDQNNDIEDLKDELDKIDSKVDEILYEIRMIKREA